MLQTLLGRPKKLALIYVYVCISVHREKEEETKSEFIPFVSEKAAVVVSRLQYKQFWLGSPHFVLVQATANNFQISG